jgi:uncharacterized protein YqeY
MLYPIETMSIQRRISSAHVEAIKAKDQIAKTILSVVKGEFQNASKAFVADELPDDEATKILTKIAKSLRETISLSGDEESKAQLLIVEAYLPKQIGRAEIEERIGSMRALGPLTIGDAMKAFAGQNVDRKLVQEVYNAG